MEPYSAARLGERGARHAGMRRLHGSMVRTCQVKQRMGAVDGGSAREDARAGVVTVRRLDARIPTMNAPMQQSGGRVPLYVLDSGREGVPPRILPQLLTSDLVITELEQLETRSRT